MTDPANPTSQQRKPILYRIAPGIEALAGYRRDWFKYDLIAGVSVAAVALPTAIAYAEIIGLEPVFGLYAAIPALLAYAMFGTSRHLIVNPDAATCAMIAAALTPLAAGDSATLVSMSVVLAVFVGLLCLVASALRLGFLADFLSKPILVGFLNGRGHQHLSGPDWKDLRLQDDIPRHHSKPDRVRSQGTPNQAADLGRGAYGDRRDVLEQAVHATMAEPATGSRRGDRRCQGI